MKFKSNKIGTSTEENKIFRPGLTETGRQFEEIFENHGKFKESKYYRDNREEYKKLDI